MCLLRHLAFQLIPTLPTPSSPASSRAPTQTQLTLLCAQIVLAFRELSLAPLATRLVLWITRLLDAPAGKREALMVALVMRLMTLVMVHILMVHILMVHILMARGVPMKEQLSQDRPTPNRSTKELVELTLRQELTPMPLLTMELPSPTLLILKLRLSLGTLSKSTNQKKAVCM